MIKKKAFVIVFVAAALLMVSDLAWSKSSFQDPASSVQAFRNPLTPPGVELSRRQQGPPQMDEDTQRNWRTYQELTPDDKNRLRDRSQKWQSLPPEQQKEMRRRMERYRELPPQDQERYQERYKQWQSLPPEDRDRIRDRLRQWDSLSPQEKEDVRQRFQKR